MENFAEMSYQQLLNLENLINKAKQEFYDLLSGEFIGTYYIATSFPTLKEKLDENNIPGEDYMRLSQIKEVWNQYKSQSRILQKDVHKNK